MNTIDWVVKTIIIIVFMFGILCGALGDEAFLWIKEQVTGP